MDRVKQILNRVLEFWNKYTRKQKGIIISVVAVALIAFGILIFTVQKPTYVTLTQCTSYAELSEVTNLLTAGGYEYQVDDSNFVVRVNQKVLTNAKMTLATADIKSSGYDLEDALKDSFSATETDKTRRYQKYLEYKFAQDLQSIAGIKSASVTVVLPDDGGIFISTKSEASVSAVLTLNDGMDEDTASGIARLLATNVGNTTTDKITLISTSGQTLFSGADTAAGPSGVVSANQREKYKSYMENGMKTNIRQGILSLGVYDDMTINLNLRYNFDAVTRVLTEYSVPEGMEQGYFAESYKEHSVGGLGVGGVPGTSSNDSDQTYVLQDGNGNYTEYTVEKYKYTPNVLVTTTTGPGVDVEYENSTMAVTFTKNIIYRESEAQMLGYVNEETTWDQFKAQNAEAVRMEIDDATWAQYLSYATGIDVGNITVIAYEKHYFEDMDTSGEGQPVSFWIQIALAAVILALLAFVVIRSAKPLTVEETEPELSVEDMLASTKEKQPTVEDIDLQNKSETRKAIEKFVDENPDAVAMLLRNWLNEGWE